MEKNLDIVKKQLPVPQPFVKSRLPYYRKLGYLKDSNAAAHSVDTGISQALGLKRIENDIEFPIYMLESTRIITISLQKNLWERCLENDQVVIISGSTTVNCRK